MRQDVNGLWVGGVHCDRLTVTTADFGQCRRREQSDPRFRYSGNWSIIGQSLASGGSYARSSTPEASATVYFRGTRLDWVAVQGLTPGVADVYLDGERRATIDLAAPVSTYKVSAWSTGDLPDGNHMVEIVRSSDSDPDERLTLDAVDIWGTLKTAP
jgi:hypothetical protein